MLLFISRVNKVFEITEELAADRSMQNTVRDNHIFLKVKKTITTLCLDFKITQKNTKGSCWECLLSCIGNWISKVNGHSPCNPPASVVWDIIPPYYSEVH